MCKRDRYRRPPGKPDIVDLTIGDLNFWGAPGFIVRLMKGWDPELFPALMSSGHWTGTEDQLSDVLSQANITANTGLVPMRDAVDFVHFGIYSTIKAIKFSNLLQVCGGPIEIAVITADRPFRWVQHKKWDSAINGET